MVSRVPDTYVDAEVEVEVDSSELTVEAGGEERFEGELTAPGLEIEVEAEVQVAEAPDDTSAETEHSDEPTAEDEHTDSDADE